MNIFKTLRIFKECINKTTTTNSLITFDLLSAWYFKTQNHFLENINELNTILNNYFRSNDLNQNTLFPFFHKQFLKTCQILVDAHLLIYSNELHNIKNGSLKSIKLLH